jgi:cystathionine beta-lyase family protein involved in aluminum resistance
LSQSAYQAFGISPAVWRLSEEAMDAIRPAFSRIGQHRETNQLRVLAAFREARLSEAHFGGSTGYGYGDLGREQIESAYASAFGAQAALVRIQISSGTQALALCLYALLRPGDELLSVTGKPYDTLQTMIGCAAEKSQADIGSLRDCGILYREVDLLPDGSADLPAICQALSPKTRIVLIQKSRGYTMRRSLLADDIRSICQTVRASGQQAVILVDNCYGEFVETAEPCMLGADLCAGSLIKNPGGGLCPSGGYVAGRSDLVEQAAGRLNAPGLGSHVGPTLGFSRLIAQGFYLAPHVVAESLKGAVFAASFLSLAGFETFPDPMALRGDIVQTVELGTADRLIAFCQAIQAASPVDSFVLPEPWAMPGYADQVIMAAGAFIQGASIELSADGPLRAPFPAYLQGGLCFENVRLACMLAVEKMGVVKS